MARRSDASSARRRTIAFRPRSWTSRRLTAYDRALEIEPRYAEAVEYRAEAYLELGRLEDCKSAYMQLYRGVPELAAQLMEKMKLFAARPAEAAGPVDSDALAAFSQWVEERDGIARQTSRLDRAAPTRW
jgi:tetratricopeptide (TPR) repeat protein